MPYTLGIPHTVPSQVPSLRLQSVPKQHEGRPDPVGVQTSQTSRPLEASNIWSPRLQVPTRFWEWCLLDIPSGTWPLG